MSGVRLDAAIAVLTYHRPDRLPLTIHALLEQIKGLPDDLSSTLRVHIRVIDNAEQPEAQDIVSLDPARITYHHEPAPGISSARNRALDESAADRLLLFVDDDIIPQPRWLELLLSLWLKERCQAVSGHVLPELPDTAEPWVAAGRYFNRPERATGSAVPAAASNNLLLDLDFLRRHNLRFSLELGHIGGEDSLLTRQLVACGGRILWCNEAKAVDPVPEDRATKRWVRQRSFRVGSSEALVAQFLDHSPGHLRSRAVFLAGGLARMAFGTMRSLAGKLASDLPQQARGARTVYRGAGQLVGACGYAYQEYGRGKKSIRKVNRPAVLEHAR
ncbi:glycosyltransferase [Glutamicibacter soli]